MVTERHPRPLRPRGGLRVLWSVCSIWRGGLSGEVWRGPVGGGVGRVVGGACAWGQGGGRATDEASVAGAAAACRHCAPAVFVYFLCGLIFISSHNNTSFNVTKRSSAQQPTKAASSTHRTEKNNHPSLPVMALSTRKSACRCSCCAASWRSGRAASSCLN